jgi:hypothetical protein
MLDHVLRGTFCGLLAAGVTLSSGASVVTAVATYSVVASLVILGYSSYIFVMKK